MHMIYLHYIGTKNQLDKTYPAPTILSAWVLHEQPLKGIYVELATTI